MVSILNPLLVIGLILNFVGVVILLYAKVVVLRRFEEEPRKRSSKFTSWGTFLLVLGFVFQALSLLI